MANKKIKKRLLLTGAKGNLGQDLRRVFLLNNYEVIATDREQLDITDRSAAEKMVAEIKPDLIINAAAYNLVDKAEDPEIYPIAFAINVIGPKNLAEVAATFNIPFVHYSTDYVFAGEKKEGYTEDDQPKPLSKYSETKYLGEQAVQKAGGHWFICRLSKIFGRPGISEASKPSFVSLMLKLAAEKPELKIVDEEIGRPSYTKDIAEATRCLVQEEFSSGVYHFVNSGEGVTWYQFAEEIFSLTGITTPRRPVSAAEFGVAVAERPKFAALVNTKFPALRSRTEALKEYLSLPKISVIIVSLNVRELLQKNLHSLFAQKNNHSLEVLLVDNGSTDGSVKMVREEFPQVRLIQNDWNSGFAHAVNQGLLLADGEVVVLFNPDMRVGPGLFDHIYETLKQKKEVGVMGVKLLDEKGLIVPSVRCDPGFFDQLMILLKVPHLFPRVTDRYLAKDFNYEKSQEVEQVRGSLFAFRREVLEQVGLFDEKNFFVWFEEVDFCRRVRQAGYKIWYSAEVFGIDLVGQYFKQVSTRVKQARFSRSLARYFFKWHPWWQGAIFSLLRPGAILVGVLVDLWRR